MNQVIIVGGGASGLTAAIMAARNKNKVTVLEHKDKIGKKILATGNGKCNYTNLYQDPSCYRGEDIDFAMQVLSSFPVEQTIDFFKELGIYPKEKNGYLYPNSEQASSVVEVLTMELKRLNVQILCSVHVESVKKVKNGFLVQSNNGDYKGDKVILAAGGCASPALGSDGSGYKLAKALGHRLIKPLPALVQLKSNEKYFKTLAGVRTEAVASLYVDNQFQVKERGELLLAAYGVSGIPILQISRFAGKALEDMRKIHLVIDFLPMMEFSQAYNWIKQRIKSNPSNNVEEVLVGLLNNKLAYVGLREVKLPIDIPGNKISDEQIKSLVKQFKEWKVLISETNSFEQAQVCAGGVDTKEINHMTMESKVVSGLYFTGELIDVDGTCGGYNLQWAWSSGVLAGKNV